MTSYQDTYIVFGSVPSRRLGRSLGVINIPPKICSYSCIYCQIGRTLQFSSRRMSFYSQAYIAKEVEKKIGRVEAQGGKIDYITFVPDGEPTLDVNLGKEIELLRQLGKKVAVITNASLMNSDAVKEELLLADLVSAKVDAVSSEIWRKINRPKGDIRLEAMLDGIREFAASYNGELLTETMLVKGVNDGVEEIDKIAEYLEKVDHAKSYLSIPTRPPAESWVAPADERTLSAAYSLFSRRAIETEYLVGYEGNEFAFTGDVENDILSITSVHPMRKDAVEEYLEKAHAGWHEVEGLVTSGKLIEASYEHELFYVRKFHR